MYKLLLLLTGCIFSVSLYAQKTTITGKVIDDTKQPVPGVNILVEGTTSGTITNFDGEYTLNLKDASKAKLVYSFIGYKSKIEEVNGRTNINVVLESAFTELNEVVAVGYGTMKKRDLLGSVGSISNEQLTKTPTPDVATAIAGKVTGVKISSNEGAPGSSISIRVRGGGSITQDNSPLYIIDGFPSEEGLAFLDPSDIETIDILKDASSAAIYGARGANGVVIVTTKSGKKGKTSIKFDAYYGVKKVSNSMDMMNPYDFVLLQYENHQKSPESMQSFKNLYGEWSELDGLYANRKGVDWQEEMFGRNAIIQNYNLGVNGGNSKTKYNISLNHNNNDGIMINSGFGRNSARMKLDQKIGKFVEASFIFGYIDQKYFGMSTSGESAHFNKMTHIARYRPTIGKNGQDSDLITMDDDPALDDSGNVQQNPIVSSEAETRETRTKNTTLNGSFKFKITKDLYFKVAGGIKSNVRRKDSYDALRSIKAKRNNSAEGYRDYSEKDSWNYSMILNYNKDFERSSFSVLLGNEQLYNSSISTRSFATGFTNDEINLNNFSIAVPNYMSSNAEEDRLLSFFTRVNYSLNDKYLFNATLRADGSSKFGPNNRFGYFPSGSFAWRFSEEDFMNGVSTLSNGKLRVSYGVSGNNRIPNYAYMPTMGAVSYGMGNVYTSAMAQQRLANPDLKWEATHSLNAGVDLGFWDQRVSFTADFYVARTKDLLLNSLVPYTMGHSSVIKNIGETENRGMEFAINTVNVKTKNFEWTSNFNISFNKNKVVALADGQKAMYVNSGWAGKKFTENDYVVEVGSPIGQMYGYVSDGLMQVDDFNYDATTKKYALKKGVPNTVGDDNVQPGFRKYKDLNEDGVINSKDRKVIGDANPIHFGGFTNTFQYKNFDLSIFFNWSYGNDIYNANKIYYTHGFDRNKNVLAVTNDRWKTFNASGDFVSTPDELKALNANATQPVYDGNVVYRSADDNIEDGSYLRLNNITIGYTLPKQSLKSVGIKSLRVYGTANNLYTWTTYSGFDPEVSTRNSSGLTPGVDWGAYPRSMTFILGVNLAF
ncbi:TonB-dependent receptor [Halosquirtibacter xylanolyticus]|uniref:SusC/RagA family TonB-linked outer membrane protein n=1 Tax=Halosquirtibacter xylanolyticus TaxID=3374599 RepID=UPI003747B015|nr:TonB-dependent receptor [Prolixibacteraceae bacterium]